jgi:hypothetical protein
MKGAVDLLSTGSLAVDSLSGVRVRAPFLPERRNDGTTADAQF